MSRFVHLASTTAMALAGLGCNALSGVNDLAFDLGDGGYGGLGGLGGTTTNEGGQGASGGAGGTGDCGACDDPPSDCTATIGSCVARTCVYEPLQAGAPCDDGDLCTTGDACDGAGQCQPGPECPNDDPCLEVACDVTAGCMATVLPDGTSCGPTTAERCCGGSCVDVSSDAAHCGGCGYGCGNGEVCESIAATNQCALNPADTSGRCTCTATSQCPVGQICRTQNRHAWRCTPEGAQDCPGTNFVDQSFCPNFCSY